MSAIRSWFAAVILTAASLVARPTLGEVLFQNTGLREGWTSIGIQHRGKVEQVATPTYRGATALRMEQTFEGLSGYHSEVRLHEAQGPQGSDVYYGLAFYLPANWIFHPQNVTFQQWARGDVFGSPWVLMFVENDEIRVGGSGGVRGVIAKITGMQATWIRVVTHIRHHPTDGLFEVWVNGTKAFTKTGDISPAAQAPIRWSVGMYCTRWRAEQPGGLDPMVMFHDHQRVASSYEEADPASWSDGNGTKPPPAPDAGAMVGADAGAPSGTPDGRAEPDAGGVSEPAPPPSSGTRARDGGAPRAADAAAVSPGDAPAVGCGCRTGRGGGTPAVMVLGALALIGSLRRSGRRQRGGRPAARACTSASDRARLYR